MHVLRWEFFRLPGTRSQEDCFRLWWYPLHCESAGSLLSPVLTRWGPSALLGVCSFSDTMDADWCLRCFSFLTPYLLEVVLRPRLDTLLAVPPSEQAQQSVLGRIWLPHCEGLNPPDGCSLILGFSPGPWQLHLLAHSGVCKARPAILVGFLCLAVATICGICFLPPVNNTGAFSDVDSTVHVHLSFLWAVTNLLNKPFQISHHPIQ